LDRAASRAWAAAPLRARVYRRRARAARNEAIRIMSQDGQLACEAPATSHAEALAAAALALDVRVPETERLVQPLLDEVDLRAVDVTEARAIDDDLHTLLIEHHVVRGDLIRVVHHVREAGAARLLHREAQPDAVAPALQERAYAIGGGCCERDGHCCEYGDQVLDWSMRANGARKAVAVKIAASPRLVTPAVRPNPSRRAPT